MRLTLLFLFLKFSNGNYIVLLGIQLSQGLRIFKDPSLCIPEATFMKNDEAICLIALKIRGLKCMFVIDSRSQRNFIAEIWVSFLRPEVKKHPNPYYIVWVHKGNRIIVEKKDV